MIVDRPLLGILLMLGFCALAPLGDATAKVLGQTIPLVQLLFARFAMQAVILLPLIWWSRISLRMTPRVLRLTGLRTAFHIVGVGAMFVSLQFLPLADAVAIAFVMPFILLLLGKVILGEEVGPRRLIACCIGFTGTLMVIQPSFAEVGAPALLPLVVAVAFAMFMLVTRQIAKDVDPIALQAVSGMMATSVLAALFVSGLGDGLAIFDLVWPGIKDRWLLIAIGIIGTVAHLLMTWSLRFAPSATLAPMQYLEIPFATVFGWVIFGDLPDGLAAAGIGVTLVAGLYVILRERAAARVPATAPPAV